MLGGSTKPCADPRIRTGKRWAEPLDSHRPERARRIPKPKPGSPGAGAAPGRSDTSRGVRETECGASCQPTSVMMLKPLPRQGIWRSAGRNQLSRRGRSKPERVPGLKQDLNMPWRYSAEPVRNRLQPRFDHPSGGRRADRPSGRSRDEEGPYGAHDAGLRFRGVGSRGLRFNPRRRDFGRALCRGESRSARLVARGGNPSGISNAVRSPISPE